jgi:hypothetical protein
LKRFALIVTIAVVVLAIGVGPAFASVCAAVACSPATMCPVGSSAACPMKTGAPVARAVCGQPMDHGLRDAVSSHTAPDRGLTVALLPGAPVAPAAIVGAVTTPLADARGAPHLSAVIRI